MSALIEWVKREVSRRKQAALWGIRRVQAGETDALFVARGQIKQSISTKGLRKFVFAASVLIYAMRLLMRSSVGWDIRN